MEENKSTLAVPGAIIIAGLLIAGAVYYSNTRGNSVPIDSANNAGQNEIPAGELSVSPVSTKDYIRGNPNAKVVLIEFSDTECPFCKVFHTTMKKLIDTHGKDGTLAWVYRNFPLKDLHPKAPKEAEALLCAGKLGGQSAFWAYTDKIYAVTPSNNKLEESQLPIIAKEVGLDVAQFNTCLSGGSMAATVTADYEDGVKAGGSGTPFSVLVAQNGFDRSEVDKFLSDSVLKYRVTPQLFQISNDNTKVAVSGAMPEEFMSALITLLAK